MANIAAPLPSDMSEHNSPNCAERPTVASAATDHESTATATTVQSPVRPARGASTRAKATAITAATTTACPMRRLSDDDERDDAVSVDVEDCALTASRVLRVCRSS
jgi:hypothetical protein